LLYNKEARREQETSGNGKKYILYTPLPVAACSLIMLPATNLNSSFLPDPQLG